MGKGQEHNCDWARGAMGLQVDGELPTADAARLEKHLHACPECRAEMAALNALVRELENAADGAAAPPNALWTAIETRLDAGVARPLSLGIRSPTAEAVGQPDAKGRQRQALTPRVIRLFRPPLAAAASLAFLIGAGVFIGTWLSGPSTQVARAESVDYSILLDNIGQGVDTAVDRFLTYYRGTPTSASAARANAADMSFNLPAELPGGYRLQRCYTLDFGNMPGVAASYRRDNEPLFVFFHPPVNKQLLGMHRESRCAVAGGAGHCVQVDGWRLIHFTDPTTCHCLLSKLHDGPEMEAVLAALAPQFEQFKGAQTQPAAHEH